MEEKQIGKITHYFSKIGVAVIELTDALNVGDTIHVFGGERDFTQVIGSMQVEHQNIETAKTDDAVGLKIDQAVKEGDKVYKVLE